jgi:MFS family permease
VTEEAQTDGLPPARRRRAMATMAMAIGVSVLGSSIANVALPTIARDLGVTPAASVWVVNAFQITVMLTLLPCSSLGDIDGYRRVYGIGLTVFTLASGLCAPAPDLPTMIAARILQGLGGAGLMSVNTALVRFDFSARHAGAGTGFNALIVASSSALGQALAAAICWRGVVALAVRGQCADRAAGAGDAARPAADATGGAQVRHSERGAERGDVRADDRRGRSGRLRRRRCG